jgi:hypothetical protein
MYKRIGALLGISQFLLVFCLIGTIETSQAQSAYLTAGPKAGLNLSSFMGKDASSASIIPGANAGFFLSYTVYDELGITAELLYSMKGAKIRNSIITNSTTRLHYVEMPILARYLFQSGTRTIPTIFAGPSLNYLITAKSTLPSEENVKDRYKKFDVGAVFGAGVNIDLDKKWWIIDVRFTPGLLKTSSLPDPKRIRNAVFSLNVAYGFNL